MKKRLNVTVLISLLVVENIFIFFLGHAYFEYKSYLKVSSNNEGLIEKCEVLTNSENLSSVVKSLKEYRPILFVNAGSIILSYGNEIADGAGVGFVFDQSYQLTNKSCSSEWTPEIPNFEFNFSTLENP